MVGESLIPPKEKKNTIRPVPIYIYGFYKIEFDIANCLPYCHKVFTEFLFTNFENLLFLVSVCVIIVCVR